VRQGLFWDFGWFLKEKAREAILNVASPHILLNLDSHAFSDSFQLRRWHERACLSAILNVASPDILLNLDSHVLVS